MPPKVFQCQQCGSCCLNLEAYYTTVDENDIKLWKRMGREDILEWWQEFLSVRMRMGNNITSMMYGLTQGLEMMSTAVLG
jgi:hypothetical protein